MFRVNPNPKVNTSPVMAPCAPALVPPTRQKTTFFVPLPTTPQLPQAPKEPAHFKLNSFNESRIAERMNDLTSKKKSIREEAVMQIFGMGMESRTDTVLYRKQLDANHKEKFDKLGAEFIAAFANTRSPLASVVNTAVEIAEAGYRFINTFHTVEFSADAENVTDSPVFNRRS